MSQATYSSSDTIARTGQIEFLIQKSEQVQNDPRYDDVRFELE